MAEPIRLLIADKYPCIREGIEHALDGDQVEWVNGSLSVEFSASFIKCPLSNYF